MQNGNPAHRGPWRWREDRWPGRNHPASPVFWARPQDPAFWADLEQRSASPADPGFWHFLSAADRRPPELLRRVMTSDPVDRHPPLPAPQATLADWLDMLQGGLDTAALVSSPFPGVGDLAGGAADALATARDPSLANFGLSALGLVPFLPGGTVKRVGEGALDAIRRGPRADRIERLAEAAKQAILRGEMTPEALEAFRRGQTARAATEAGRRATAQGFLDPVFLHGTNQDIRPTFSSRHSGAVTGTTKLDQRLARTPAAFLVSDPAAAGLYALNAVEETGKGAANIVPVKVRADRPIKMNAGGLPLTTDLDLLTNLKLAEEAGIERFGAPPDMVFIDNLPPIREGGKPVTMVVAYDPAKLRSVFAEFNPERAASGDLLASLAGAGLLLSVAGAPRLLRDPEEG